MRRVSGTVLALAGAATLWQSLPAAAQSAPDAPPASPAPVSPDAKPPAAAPAGPAPSAQAPAAPPPANPPPPMQQAQPAAPPPGTPAPPVTAGTPATVLDTQDYDAILGKGVRSAAGEDMGRIIDVVLDKDGRPRAAIIDFGGFLGVGSRKIAVDWRVLHFSPDGKPGRVVLQLTRNQVRVSPEYKAGEPIVVLGPASPGPATAEADPARAGAAAANPTPPPPPPAAPPVAPATPAAAPAPAPTPEK